MFSGNKTRAQAPAGGKAADKAPPGPPSILAPDLLIEGNVVSSGDIQLDGTVTGDVHTRKLTVGEKARVTGAIIAEWVRISGTVQGEITAVHVELMASAKVTGDINHDTLSIDAGAYIQGLCRRMDSGQKRRVEEAISGKAKPGSAATEAERVVALEPATAKG